VLQDDEFIKIVYLNGPKHVGFFMAGLEEHEKKVKDYSIKESGSGGGKGGRRAAGGIRKLPAGRVGSLRGR
jgi:hypothetical protein